MLIAVHKTPFVAHYCWIDLYESLVEVFYKLMIEDLGFRVTSYALREQQAQQPLSQAEKIFTETNASVRRHALPPTH
jgi:hypothetical protein